MKCGGLSSETNPICVVQKNLRFSRPKSVLRECGHRRMFAGGTDHRIGSNVDQLSGSAQSSGSKRIFEVVYFAVSFRGRPMTGE
jgi:hypothetical protein